MRPLIRASVLWLPVALTGCGGADVIDTKEELPVSCLNQPDPGSCRGAKRGFYYDYRDNRCKPFTYGGCAGRVPFQTREECVGFCGADN